MQQGVARHRLQALGKGDSPVHELVVGNHAVDQAPVVRLARAQSTIGEQQLARSRQADAALEERRRAAVRGEPQAEIGGGEAGALGCQAVVGRQGQAHARRLPRLPLSAAMTGTGVSTMAVIARWWTATSSATPNDGSANVASHLRSAPAQKAGPLPVRMTGLLRAEAWRSSSTSAWSSAGIIALRWSGRFSRRMVAAARARWRSSAREGSPPAGTRSAAEAGAQAAAESLEQRAVARAFQTVHLKAAQLVEANGRFGFHRGATHIRTLRWEVAWISDGVHCRPVRCITGSTGLDTLNGLRVGGEL